MTTCSMLLVKCYLFTRIEYNHLFSFLSPCIIQNLINIPSKPITPQTSDKNTSFIFRFSSQLNNHYLLPTFFNISYWLLAVKYFKWLAVDGSACTKVSEAGIDISISNKWDAETGSVYTSPCHPESCAEFISVSFQGLTFYYCHPEFISRSTVPRMKSLTSKIYERAKYVGIAK